MEDREQSWSNYEQNEDILINSDISTTEMFSQLHKLMCSDYEPFEGMDIEPPPFGSYRFEGIKNGQRTFYKLAVEIVLPQTSRKFLYYPPCTGVDEMMPSIGSFNDRTLLRGFESTYDIAEHIAVVRTLLSLTHPYLDGNTRVKNSWSILTLKKLGVSINDSVLDKADEYNVSKRLKMKRLERDASINALSYLGIPLVEIVLAAVYKKEIFNSIEEDVDRRGFFLSPVDSWNTKKYDSEVPHRITKFIRTLKKEELSRKKKSHIFGEYAQSIYEEWIAD